MGAGRPLLAAELKSPEGLQGTEVIAGRQVLGSWALSQGPEGLERAATGAGRPLLVWLKQFRAAPPRADVATGAGPPLVEGLTKMMAIGTETFPGFAKVAVIGGTDTTTATSSTTGSIGGASE